MYTVQRQIVMAHNLQGLVWNRKNQAHKLFMQHNSSSSMCEDCFHKTLPKQSAKIVSLPIPSIAFNSAMHSNHNSYFHFCPIYFLTSDNAISDQTLSTHHLRMLKYYYQRMLAMNETNTKEAYKQGRRKTRKQVVIGRVCEYCSQLQCSSFLCIKFPCSKGGNVYEHDQKKCLT